MREDVSRLNIFTANLLLHLSVTTGLKVQVSDLEQRVMELSESQGELWITINACTNFEGLNFCEFSVLFL